MIYIDRLGVWIQIPYGYMLQPGVVLSNRSIGKQFSFIILLPTIYLNLFSKWAFDAASTKHTHFKYAFLDLDSSISLPHLLVDNFIHLFSGFISHIDLN